MSCGRVREAVVAAIEELTGRRAASIRDEHLLVDDLSVDSIAAVNLLISVEERMGCEVPEGWEGAFVDVRTVGELIAQFAAAFSGT
jgi:acyl carrier protein